jgi:hypothetical protein
VGTDVIACDIGQNSPIAIAIPLKDQRLLAPHPVLPVIPAPKVEAELERHVEAGEVSLPKRLDARNVVDAETTGPNQISDPVHTGFTRVGTIQGKPRLKPALENGEDQALKERQIFRVEGAIDEQTPIETVGAAGHREQGSCLLD